MIGDSDQVKKILTEKDAERETMFGGQDPLGSLESMRTEQSNMQSAEITTYEDLIEQAIELMR